MNKKLLNTQIKSVTQVDGPKIVDFYQSNGFDTRNFEGGAYELRGWTYIFYGVDRDGNFTNRDGRDPDIKTITLEEAKQLVSSEYPKVMRVWNAHEDLACERVVFMEKCGKFLAWINVSTLEASEKECNLATWNYAKGIEEEVHISMEEIAKLKGCNVSQLRIKDV
jgi:hypothetical protein